MTAKMDITDGKRIALEELRTLFEKTYLAGDTLDGKLQNILAFSTVIVSIAFTVLASTLLDKVGLVFWVALLIVLIIYLCAFWTSISGLRSTAYEFPVSVNADALVKLYFSVNSDALAQDISDHLHCIEKTSRNNAKKSRAVDTSLWLVMVMVIILFAAIPFGLLIPSPTLSQVLHPVVDSIGCLLRLRP